MNQNVYIKATQYRDTIGFIMLWADYPELTEAGVWPNKADDVDTVEYKLIMLAKQHQKSQEHCGREMIVHCTNPAAYVCLDPNISIKFVAHSPHDSKSVEAVGAALHYAKP